MRTEECCSCCRGSRSPRRGSTRGSRRCTNLGIRPLLRRLEVVDLRLLLTSHVLEVLAARLRDRWALWSCYRERAVRSVLAGGRVGGALLEEEAVAWSVVVEEGEEHELVAVSIRSTLCLALQL